MTQLSHIGTKDAPVILFGGPYSNLQALEAVLGRARQMGIAPDHIISTGDVVAYGADGQACIDLIRASGIHVVAGNCEKQLGASAGDCGCGFEAGSTCAILSDGWYPHALKTINEDSKAWMAGLPDGITFTHLGKTYAVIHGGMSDIARFMWSNTNTADFADEMTLLDQRCPDIAGVFAGHSGIAFERQIGARPWINAGALGMPQNDGDPRTIFTVLSGGAVRFERLDYDHETAARAMEAASLTQGYQTALRTGHWPSEDVLPLDLRRRAAPAGLR